MGHASTFPTVHSVTGHVQNNKQRNTYRYKFTVQGYFPRILYASSNFTQIPPSLHVTYTVRTDTYGTTVIFCSIQAYTHLSGIAYTYSKIQKIEQNKRHTYIHVTVVRIVVVYVCLVKHYLITVVHTSVGVITYNQANFEYKYSYVTFV